MNTRPLSEPSRKGSRTRLSVPYRVIIACSKAADAVLAFPVRDSYQPSSWRVLQSITSARLSQPSCRTRNDTDQWPALVWAQHGKPWPRCVGVGQGHACELASLSAERSAALNRPGIPGRFSTVFLFMPDSAAIVR